MPITMNVLVTSGVNATGYINHVKHSHLVPQGPANFDLVDPKHDFVIHAHGSGFKYMHGVLRAGAVTSFDVEQAGIATLDVTLAPALKASEFAGSGFANYFTNTRYVFNGNDGNDSFKSGHGGDLLIGGKGGDNLDGNIGNDRVEGGEGDDTLNGNRGNDTIIGGLGRDTLSGGKDRDKFVFNDVAESVVGPDHDVIINFHRSQRDKIVLAGIDADISQTGDQAFTFIGSNDFGSVAGQLRFSGGLLQGDTDGDGAADFEVAVLNVGALAAGDFVL